MIGRRALLGAAGAAAATTVLGSACASPGGGSDAPPVSPITGQRLARVRVSRDRVIRTVVGLRPFRPSGFVLRGERAGDKTIIHDFGHGGGGVSLSMGTAHLAADEAGATGENRCAVIGCGAIGLATARQLQTRGWDVTIYAKDLPPDTTSNIAGAQWAPFSVFDPGRTDSAFDRQFDRAARLAYRHFQDLTGDYYGVRWVSNYSLSDRPFGSGESSIGDLFPESRDLGPGEHPFASPYVRHSWTMFIEPLVFLQSMLREFFIAGGTVHVREFLAPSEVLELDEPVIMNCTGLGARALFEDDQLMPIKGQLTVLLPQPEVDYLVLGNGLYMFPRTDGILLGGTFERDEWSLEVNREAEERILAGHERIFGAMRG